VNFPEKFVNFYLSSSQRKWTKSTGIADGMRSSIAICLKI